MLDTTIKTYATRQLGRLVLAGTLAIGLAFAGGTYARTPGAGTGAPANGTLPSVSGAPAAAGSAQRPLITGEARVIDGDTIELGGIKVRLEGIDAPESGQTCLTRLGQTWHCGAKASHALAHLIARQPITCEDLGRDKYGRTLGTCYAGSLNLNAEMVRIGYAWAFMRYSTAYVGLEAAARQARAGIWEGEAQPAWDYRAGRWTVAETGAPEGCAIKGNVTAGGRIYHMPWSPWYDKVKMDTSRGKRWFCTEAEAVAAGWRPAQSF